MLKLNRRGMSLVIVLIATAVASVVAMTLASMFMDGLRSQKVAERKYSINGLGQSVKDLFASPSLCKCNFDPLAFPATAATLPTGETGSVLSNVSVTTLKYYKDAACTTDANSTFLDVGSEVPGESSLTIASMTLKNPTALPGDKTSADLEIAFSMAGAGVVPKPLVVPNMIFKTTTAGSTAQINDCVSVNNVATTGATADVTPNMCGPGKFCWGSNKSVQFLNENNNEVATTLVSAGGNVFEIMFSAAAGRNTLIRFTDDGTNLVPAAVTGWLPQLCFSHPAPPCTWLNYFGVAQYNCSNAVKWSGTYTGNTITGNTIALKTTCP